jgi:hypothetical protein
MVVYCPGLGVLLLTTRMVALAIKPQHKKTSKIKLRNIVKGFGGVTKLVSGSTGRMLDDGAKMEILANTGNNPDVLFWGKD